LIKFEDNALVAGNKPQSEYEQNLDNYALLLELNKGEIPGAVQAHNIIPISAGKYELTA
jgi:hypothetical protein